MNPKLFRELTMSLKQAGAIARGKGKSVGALRPMKAKGTPRLKSKSQATSARYDRRRARVVVTLSNGLELAFPAELAEGLAGAKPTDLNAVELSPTGLGLHWPRLDADLYIPALLEGLFGSRRWMAGLMGSAGGKATTRSKQAAARANGRLGGRPRKVMAASDAIG